MSSDPGGTSRRDGAPRVNRLLALSDGVIAIALTLLVLQLRVPALDQVADPDSAADLATQLGKGSAQLVSYGISFYVIAQFWIVHRQIFRLVGDQEEGLEWWNFAFLFTITIMPFTSTLLGAFVRNPLAVDIFALNLLLASLATQAMIVVGRHKGLLISDAKARAGRISAAVVPIVMAVSIGLSWWSTAAAMYSWILIAVAPGIINRRSARRARGYQHGHPPATGSDGHLESSTACSVTSVFRLRKEPCAGGACAGRGDNKPEPHLSQAGLRFLLSPGWLADKAPGGETPNDGDDGHSEECGAVTELRRVESGNEEPYQRLIEVLRT